jgi:general stress protein 26
MHRSARMATQTRTQREQEQEVPTEKKLEQLYELIDGIEIAMMTTRRPDGSLVSRPMATQTRTEGTDIWFMTNVETAKVDELIADPHVNLGYFKDGTGEYVSVSGIAHVTQDKARIHELYAPDWKAWLGDEGGERDGHRAFGELPEDEQVARAGAVQRRQGHRDGQTASDGHDGRARPQRARARSGSEALSPRQLAYASRRPGSRGVNLTRRLTRVSRRNRSTRQFTSKLSVP